MARPILIKGLFPIKETRPYRWGRIFVIGAALLFGAYKGIGNNIEYSNGVKTGVINKVSETGLFWKTYEGQMALEGILSENDFFEFNAWNFSIDRQAWHGENPGELADKLRGYLDSGTKVKVTYVQPFTVWPWRAGTTFLIQNVEPSQKK